MPDRVKESALSLDELDNERRVRFREFFWGRHVLVFGVLALLCVIMYGHATTADFQFDDEPNITKCEAVKMKELTWDGLKTAAFYSSAPNRLLVSLSFALHNWSSQFIPEMLYGTPGRPAQVSTQFRVFNYFVHLFAGFGVYFLLLRILQLPKVRARFKDYVWPLATIITLIWYCSPVHTQSVTYIVQRATSMAGMFYVWTLVCYLEARASKTSGRRNGFFAGAMILALMGMFSKEWCAVVGGSLLLMEYLLIHPLPIRDTIRWFTGKGAASNDADGNTSGAGDFIEEDLELKQVIGEHGIRSLWWNGAVIIGFSVVLMIGVSWFYGRKSVRRSQVKKAVAPKLNPIKAAERAYFDFFAGVLSDRLIPKIKMSPRQRLMTEARVMAMYQHLLFFPAHNRLTLDYDFLETTRLFAPGEYETFEQLLPLLMVLLVTGLTILSPRDMRARTLLLLLIVFTVIDYAYELQGERSPWRIANLWLNPWPIPSILLHLILAGFAAVFSFRRPLLAFGLAFFYLGHMVESTVIGLEVVYEHRLYLPSVGFYLALVIVIFDAFFPAREEELGPRVFGGPSNNPEADSLLS